MWVRQAELDQGIRGVVSTDERKRQNRKFRRANEILRKASALFAQAELRRIMLRARGYPALMWHRA